VDSKSLRRQNLAILERQFDTLAEIERRTNGEVTASYLSQVKNGYRQMGDKVARALEQRLDRPAGWMDRPNPDEDLSSRNPTDLRNKLHAAESTGSVNQRYNVVAHPQPRSRLPLISWVSAGLKDDANDPYAPGNAEDWVDFDSEASKSAFCLRVRGESMVRADGTGFPDGCIIAVEPRRKPKSGEFVVFRFNDSDEATFKQFWQDGPLKMLRPLNPTFPVIALGPDAQLVGTVFEKRMIERF
jgi:SOS-response transcriptional repressor LexA